MSIYTWLTKCIHILKKIGLGLFEFASLILVTVLLCAPYQLLFSNLTFFTKVLTFAFLVQCFLAILRMAKANGAIDMSSFAPEKTKTSKDILREKVLRNQKDLDNIVLLVDYMDSMPSDIMGLDMDGSKAWLQQCAKIPTECIDVKIPFDLAAEEFCELLKNKRKGLDDIIIGLDEVKNVILDFWLQTATSQSNEGSHALALVGDAGVGKTRLVNKGVAKVFERPVHTIYLSGLKDSHTLTGFARTWRGATCGSIVQALIDTECANPIIYLDELEKASEEVQLALLPILDPEQNKKFHDQFFGNLNIDLSSVTFFASVNNLDLLHPILRDRLVIHKITKLNSKEQLAMIQQCIFPNLQEQYKHQPLMNNLKISEDVWPYIVLKAGNQNRAIKNLVSLFLQKLNRQALTATGVFCTANKESNRKSSKKLNEELNEPNHSVYVTLKDVQHILKSIHWTEENLNHMYI